MSDTALEWVQTGLLLVSIGITLSTPGFVPWIIKSARQHAQARRRGER